MDSLKTYHVKVEKKDLFIFALSLDDCEEYIRKTRGLTAILNMKLVTITKHRAIC